MIAFKEIKDHHNNQDYPRMTIHSDGPEQEDNRFQTSACPHCPSSDAYHIYQDGHGVFVTHVKHTTKWVPGELLWGTLRLHAFPWTPLAQLPFLTSSFQHDQSPKPLFAITTFKPNVMPMVVPLRSLSLMAKALSKSEALMKKNFRSTGDMKNATLFGKTSSPKVAPKQSQSQKVSSTHFPYIKCLGPGILLSQSALQLLQQQIVSKEWEYLNSFEKSICASTMTSMVRELKPRSLVSSTSTKSMM